MGIGGSHNVCTTNNIYHINIGHFTAQLSKRAARRSANCTVQCKPTVTGEALEWALGDLRDFCPVITPSYSPYTSHQSAQYIPCNTYLVMHTLSNPRARAFTVRRNSHSGRGEDFYGNSCNSGTESRKIVPKVGNEPSLRGLHMGH